LHSPPDNPWAATDREASGKMPDTIVIFTRISRQYNRREGYSNSGLDGSWGSTELALRSTNSRGLKANPTPAPHRERPARSRSPRPAPAQKFRLPQCAEEKTAPPRPAHRRPYAHGRSLRAASPRPERHA